MGLFDGFTADIGVDLGTCNTLIYVKGKGIVINEPSVVAVERGTKTVVAVGENAKRMLWKTPDNITAIRPLKDGVIADMDTTEKMIKFFISKIIPRHRIFKPNMKIGIPSCITEVERRAVIESALKAGARNVQVIQESLAAAIGAKIPINEPAGHMVCDIGGGTTEVSVISLSGMVVSNAIRVGGDKFDEAIIRYIQDTHNLIIGPQMAERIKIEIGSAVPEKIMEKMEINGTDKTTGLPRRLPIDATDVRQAMNEPINQIVSEIKRTLGETPPELSADIMERGIVMTGGGSLLRDFPKLISKETGVPVILAEDPLSCVAIGAGLSFELDRDTSADRSIYDSLNS